MSPCPYCSGKGTLLAHLYYGGSRGEWKEIVCVCCCGDGEVPDETAKAIERGRKMKADRIDRRESLLDAAQRLGMGPAELSALERGYVRDNDRYRAAVAKKEPRHD